MSAYLLLKLDKKIQKLIEGLPPGEPIPTYQELRRLGQQARKDEEARIQASLEVPLSDAAGADRYEPVLSGIIGG
jgi:hypothetical protein